jgi:uncharacterized membrane protein
MTEWWNSLASMDQIYWGIALVSTIVLFFQTLLMFVGGDVDADTETDFTDFEHGTGLHLLSIRGILAAFTGFGWGGISAISLGASATVSVIVAIGCGLFFMLCVAYMLAFFQSLAVSGTLELGNSVGQTGSVYIAIPSNRGGAGQVTVMVQGQQRQLRAVTDNDETLPSGASVKVLEALPDNSVLVDRA